MSTESQPSAVLPTKPRRRRWLRRLLLLLLVLIPLLLSVPYAVAFAPVRRWIEGRATAQLGADCRLEALSFSWFHGLSAEGLEVANPPGFTRERPSLRVGRLSIDVARTSTLGVVVRLDGPELFVEQAADGTTNLQRLGGERSPAPGPDGGGGQGGSGRASSLAIDVVVQNGRVEVRREGVLLETARDVSCTVLRAPGSPRTHVAVAADLSGGRTSLELDHHRDGGALRGTLTTPGLQLARWQPLVQTFLPDRITALEGTLDGTLSVDHRADGSLVLDGAMAVDAPKLGGPLVGGLLLGGARWTLTPAVTVGPRASSPTVDLRRAVLDLGWLQLRGKEPAAGSQLAFAGELDLAALAAFDPTGELVPVALRDSGARLQADVAIPQGALPGDAIGWAKAIVATARLQLPRLTTAGFQFADVNVSADLRDGACALVTGDTVRLDGGPLSLAVRVDLADLDLLPTTATLRWQGGALHGGTAAALRYVVPLLTGLDGGKASLTGSCDLELDFAGPALRRQGQGWLSWLDAWRGAGSLGLRDAGFVPPPALQGLLAPLGPLNQGTSPLGERGRLRIDSFTAPFQFASGAVRTTAGEWLNKGRRIGLAGTVGFDGSLAYELDLSALLRGHRDGEKVLRLLSGALPPATIAGSLDAPQLALPSLDGVLQRVLQGDLRQQGESLLRKTLDDLLQKK